LTTDLEATQEVEPVPAPAPSNVREFTGVPYRITAEAVIRHLLSNIDKVEDIAVVFRLKSKQAVMLNYSTDMHGLDLAIGGMTITELAKQKLGLLEGRASPEDFT
jgi:hypothetical protein